MMLIFRQFQRVDPNRPTQWVIRISFLLSIYNLVAFTLWTLCGAAIAQGFSKPYQGCSWDVDCAGLV
jgi:hypothetical protein